MKVETNASPLDVLLAALDEPNPNYVPGHDAARVDAADTILATVEPARAPNAKAARADEAIVARAEVALANIMTAKTTPLATKVRAAAILAKRGWSRPAIARASS